MKDNEKNKKNKRDVFILESKLTIEQRGQLIKEFEKSKNGILLMTYDLGATGINLQFCSNMILCDFWWNISKTDQAKGRINRYGQKAKKLNIYLLTSNTGIENIILKKQFSKASILKKLSTEFVDINSIPKVKMVDIIKFLDKTENIKIIKDIDNL